MKVLLRKKIAGSLTAVALLIGAGVNLAHARLNSWHQTRLTQAMIVQSYWILSSKAVWAMALISKLITLQHFLSRAQS